MYLSRKAQIAHLKTDEAFTKVPSKYTNFANVFSLKWAIELLKYIRINNYAIKLIDDWQLPYNPIYSLRPVKLETLKTYIKNNLVNGFIRPSKFFIRVLILFNKKPNGRLRLCVNYPSFNNLIMKKSVSLTHGWSIIRLTRLGLMFHLA